MKKISLVLGLTLCASMSFADVYNMTCTTAKGTELKMTYDNYPAKMISLSIGGNDMRSQVVGQFGTTGGKPYFTLRDFPKAGQTTQFTLWGPNSTYLVNGQSNPINCTAQPAKAKPVVDNSF